MKSIRPKVIAMTLTISSRQAYLRWAAMPGDIDPGLICITNIIFFKVLHFAAKPFLCQYVLTAAIGNEVSKILVYRFQR